MRIVQMQKTGSVPVEQGLLHQAIAFYNGGSRCITDVCITPSVTNSPMAPAIVCFAFSVELYFKLLHAIETGAPSKGHDLAELFSSLPQGTQDAVVKESGAPDFATQLQAVSSAFVQWRYQHEHETLTARVDTLTNAARASHRLVRRLRPNLHVFGENDVAKFFEPV